MFPSSVYFLCDAGLSDTSRVGTQRHIRGVFLSDRRSFLQMASVTDSKTGVKDASDQNFDYMFKLLIIGNSSVGKTSFLFRYADDTFIPAFVSTVGIDFKVKTVYRHEKRVKLQIWVSSGPLGQDCPEGKSVNSKADQNFQVG